MRDCWNVLRGCNVAAVYCNEIMLNTPNRERIFSPGQEYRFGTKMGGISVSFAVHKRSHDPSLAPDCLYIRKSRNWARGRVRGLIEWNPYED